MNIENIIFIIFVDAPSHYIQVLQHALLDIDPTLACDHIFFYDWQIK